MSKVEHDGTGWNTGIIAARRVYMIDGGKERVVKLVTNLVGNVVT